MNRAVAVLILALALGGCSSQGVSLRPVERTSGATGTLQTKAGDNGNTRVAVQVEHMPRPDAIDPAFRTYVLWLRPTGEQDWKNMGALRVDDSREAKLEVVTPYPSFDVQVTAEPDATVDAPGSTVVLTGSPG